MTKKIVLGFPSPWMPLMITAQMKKGQSAGYHVVGHYPVFMFEAPIILKPNDSVWIDTRNGIVEVVEREKITIYRRAWLN